MHTSALQARLVVHFTEFMTRSTHSHSPSPLGLRAQVSIGSHPLALPTCSFLPRPPTKNTDRIQFYKLMVATSTGVVKDAYQGRDERFKITGLKPNTEYILCVKAIYDDGSFLWSDPKAYCTKL